MIVQIKDGPKNLTVLVKGISRESFGPELVFDLAKLQKPREGWKGLRLDSAIWIIQEKGGIGLWWGQDWSEENFFLLMESRNSFRPDTGISSPRMDDGWGGKLFATGANRIAGAGMAYFFSLDFEKQ
jgi:hypothetical protein